MRTKFFLAILLLSSGAFAQEMDIVPIPKHAPPSIPDLGFAEASITPRPDVAFNKPVNDALDKSVDKELFDKTPLNQALDKLAKDAHLNFSINWAALESAGVTRDTPMSINVADISARKTLSMLLSEAGGGTVNLHFIVEDKQVVISTKDDLQSTKYQVVIVYDLRPVFADFEIDSPQAAEIADGIMETLKASVDPDSWRDAGGTVGSIRMLSGQLIVNQTAENQDLLANLLKQMTEGASRATRAYDVHDLIRDDPAAATQPGQAGDKVHALVAAIEANCGRDTWRDNGGKTSSLAFFDGKLYITTKPAVHDQITALLALIRKKD